MGHWHRACDLAPGWEAVLCTTVQPVIDAMAMDATSNRQDALCQP